MITYGSACSGIESASLAWEPLGWRASWFAEIEPFPCAVLAYHWPHVPNLGDMTRIHQKVLWGSVAAPDVLIAGTPCQAFSVAGLREGLDDDRGQLTLSYMRLCDANDFIRRREGKPETVIVWENVPGVLSSKDNAFGCFLAGLAGDDAEIEPSDRPETGKSNKYWRWDKKLASTFQSGQTRVVLLDPKEQSHGESLTPNISEWPNDAAVCSLSQVLEQGSIPQRFFLSKKACEGILRRAEKRGKKLPDRLNRALQQAAFPGQTVP